MGMSPNVTDVLTPPLGHGMYAVQCFTEVAVNESVRV